MSAGQLERPNISASTIDSAGDLFYLVVKTLEGNTVHITAVPSGFYVNKTVDDVFDPSPAEISHKGYTLIDTLKQVSLKLCVRSKHN